VILGFTYKYSKVGPCDATALGLQGDEECGLAVALC